MHFYSDSSSEEEESSVMSDLLNSEASSDFQPGRPYGRGRGDIYNFNVDLENIKAPKKEEEKQKESRKPYQRQPINIEVAPNPNSEFAKVLKAMQVSDSSISISESGENPQSKIMHWSKMREQMLAKEPSIDPSGQHSDSARSASGMFKTEDAIIHDPSESDLGRNSRLEGSEFEARSDFDSGSEFGKPSKYDRKTESEISKNEIVSRKDSDFSRRESDMSRDYSRKDSEFSKKDLESYRKELSSNKNESDFYRKEVDPYRDLLNKYSDYSSNSQKASDISRQDIPRQDISKIEHGLPRKDSTSDLADKPPRDPKSTEAFDLKQKIGELQIALETKQERIYELEKLSRQQNLTQIEQAAIESLKTQLREAKHNSELLKIENEELLKQVDYAEAKAQEFEFKAEELSLLLAKKDRAIEEAKLTESRTSQLTLKEYERKLEAETSEFALKLQKCEMDLLATRQELARADVEKKELRQKLFERREQTALVKDLEHQIYLLSQHKHPSAQGGQAKEIETLEKIIQEYQRDNERLVQEMKELKGNIKDQQLGVFSENKKVEQLKSQIVGAHGGLIVKEEASDIQSLNQLAGGSVISKEEYSNMKEGIHKLNRKIDELEQALTDKESELKSYIVKESFYQKQISELKSKKLQEEITPPQKLPAGKTQREAVPKKKPAEKPSATQKMSDSRRKTDTLKVEDVTHEKPKTASTVARPKTASQNENLYSIRIKELEKQLEDTKTYYIKKLSEKRQPKPVPVAQKPKKYQTGFSVFNFLTSAVGSLWLRICQDISKVNRYVTGKNNLALIGEIEHLVEVLDTDQQSIHNIKAIREIQTKLINMAQLLAESTDWNAVNLYYKEIITLAEKEVLNISNEMPVEEDTNSDFSDDDYENEDVEDQRSFKALRFFQTNIESLETLPNKLFYDYEVLKILSAKSTDFLGVEAFVRRLPVENTQIDLGMMVRQLGEKPAHWWRDQLSKYSFDMQRKTIVKHSSHFTKLKLNSLQKTNPIEKLFEINSLLTKKTFRKRILQTKYPLNREDCYVLTNELDPSFGLKEIYSWMNSSGEEKAKDKDKQSDDSSVNKFKEEEYNKLYRDDASYTNREDYSSDHREDIQAARTMQYDLGQKEELRAARTMQYASSNKEEAIRRENELSKLTLMVELLSTENENLKTDKVKLETQVKQLPPTSADIYSIQRKLENLEMAHYHREQELRNRIDAITFSSNQKLEDAYAQFANERAEHQAKLSEKNTQLASFREELDLLLTELDRLRDS